MKNKKKKKRPAKTITKRESVLSLTISRILVLACLVLIPFISSTSLTSDPWDVWKVTALRILTIAATAFLLWSGFANRKLVITKTGADIPLAVFLLIGLASSIFSDNRAISFFGQYLRYEGWTTWLLYGLIMWLTVQLFNEDLWIQRLLKTWVAVVVVMAVYGILQHFGIDFRSWQTGGPFAVFRSFGTIGNPLGFSAFLIMSVPLLIYSAIKANTNETRILYASAFVVVIAAVLFSFSRAGWVGMLVSLLFFIPFVFLELNTKANWRIISVTFAVVLVIITALGLLPSGVEGRSSLIHAGQIMSEIGAGSGASRLHLWSLTVNDILKHPWLGHGFDMYKEISSRFLDLEQFKLEPDTLFDRPHSNILQIAFSTGLFGAAAYLWLIFSIVFGWLFTRQSAKEQRLLQASLASGCLAYFTAIQFGFTVVSTAPTFFIVSGLLLGISSRMRPDRVVKVRMEPVKTIEAALKASIAIVVLILSIASFKPLLADFYYRQGRSHNDIESAQRSVSILDKAIALNPYVSDYYEDKARALFYMASSGSDNIDTEFAFAAINSFKLSAEMGIGDMQAYAGIAEIYYRLGDAIEAERYSRKALAQYRFSGATKGLLARSLAKQGKYVEAQKQWNEFIKFRPQEADGYVGLGAVLYLQGEKSQAQVLFERALKIEPGNKQAAEAIDLLKSK